MAFHFLYGVLFKQISFCVQKTRQAFHFLHACTHDANTFWKSFSCLFFFWKRHSKGVDKPFPFLILATLTFNSCNAKANFNLFFKNISFTGLKDFDLGDCEKKNEERSISDDTKKQYDSKLKVYQNFLNELGQTWGQPLTILPINVEYVKQCFSFLVESKQVKNIQYLKILLAALRKHCWFNGCSSVKLLETENENSNFGRFWVGLQKTIPEHIPEPKKALSPDTMSSVILRLAQKSSSSPNL